MYGQGDVFSRSYIIMSPTYARLTRKNSRRNSGLYQASGGGGSAIWVLFLSYKGFHKATIYNLFSVFSTNLFPRDQLCSTFNISVYSRGSSGEGQEVYFRQL